MIWNIIDARKNPHKWKKIDAVAESTAHDNSCKGADIFDEEDDYPVQYEEYFDVPLRDAVLWAESLRGKVTLYIYDHSPEGDWSGIDLKTAKPEDLFEDIFEQRSKKSSEEQE